MLKKIGYSVLMGVAAVVAFASTANAQSSTAFGDPSSTAGIGVAGAGVSQGEGLRGVLVTLINYVLGLLALIALVMLLYGGFQMVTAAGDDGKYKVGFTIVKQAGIGLAFIGLSWFMVQFIIFLVNL